MTKTMEKWGAQGATFKLVAINRVKQWVKDSDGRIYHLTNLSTAEEKGIVSTEDGETYTIVDKSRFPENANKEGLWLIKTREVTGEAATGTWQ